MKTYDFNHADENKKYDGRKYSKEFSTEQEAFDYLYRRNNSQKYCYGCYDNFTDVFINSRYNRYISSLSIGEYHRLMAY